MSTKWSIATTTAGTFQVTATTRTAARETALDLLESWGLSQARITDMEPVAEGKMPAYRNINMGRVTA